MKSRSSGAADRCFAFLPGESRRAASADREESVPRQDVIRDILLRSAQPPMGADVSVQSGPVAGRVVIGDQHSSYRRTSARRVVVERHRPRLIVVERSHRQHHARYWRRHGYRSVSLYYVEGRYYERYHGYHSGLREVVVYQRDGRYYRACDDDHRHDSRDDRGRHHHDLDD